MLTEVRLIEGSILYGPGANPLTPLTGMKGEDLYEVTELFGLLEKALHRGNWQDETYLRLQSHYDTIGLALKARTTEPPKSTQPDEIKAADLIAAHLKISL